MKIDLKNLCKNIIIIGSIPLALIFCSLVGMAGEVLVAPIRTIYCVIKERKTIFKRVIIRNN